MSRALRPGEIRARLDNLILSWVDRVSMKLPPMLTIPAELYDASKRLMRLQRHPGWKVAQMTYRDVIIRRGLTGDQIAETAHSQGTEELFTKVIQGLGTIARDA